MTRHEKPHQRLYQDWNSELTAGIITVSPAYFVFSSTRQSPLCSGDLKLPWIGFCSPEESQAGRKPTKTAQQHLLSSPSASMNFSSAALSDPEPAPRAWGQREGLSPLAPAQDSVSACTTVGYGHDSFCSWKEQCWWHNVSLSVCHLLGEKWGKEPQSVCNECFIDKIDINKQSPAKQLNMLQNMEHPHQLMKKTYFCQTFSCTLTFELIHTV